MNIIEKIEKSKIGKVEKNVPLKKCTTYKAGGIAEVIVTPKNVEKLILLLKLLKENNTNFKILGNGSNLLFSDEPYKDVLIKLTELDKCEIKDTVVKVGAGASLISVAMKTAKEGLTGMEFATGIPGTVGGAVYMNAGAYKTDMGYVVTSIKVLTPDLEIKTMYNKELDFHYRTSFLQKNKDYICLEATISLVKGNPEEIMELIDSRKQRRIESQPLEYPSAGSVFRNPEGDFAGRLIEEIGYKGKSIGGAKVSEKHANFIINNGGATGEEIKELINEIKDKVKEKYNIELKVEQEFVE